MGVTAGCSGALDGMLLFICSNSQEEAPNSYQFLSGHYEIMGVNVKGPVDSHLHFFYLGVLGGGRSNDYLAYEI
jgi:hypothetical protein